MIPIYSQEQNQFNPQQVTDFQERVMSACQKLNVLDIEYFLSYVADDINYSFGKVAEGIGKASVKTALDYLLTGVLGMYPTFNYFFQTANTVVAETEITFTKRDSSEIILSGVVFIKMEKGLIKVMKIFMDFAPVCR